MAYWWLLRARWEMHRLRGPRWLQERQSTGHIASVAPAQDAGWVAQRVRFISIASRYPCRWSLCLQSSLALQDWLNQGGVYPNLRIGVCKSGERFLAHAWLELDGRVLNDRPSVPARFASLDLRNIPSKELAKELPIELVELK
jgi:hypothetical protein